MSSLLNLEPVSLQELPDIQAVLTEAKALIRDIPNWTEGKVYRETRTHKKPMNGPAWHSRTSVHESKDGTFEEFWNCLGVNHSLNEKDYVPEVRSAQQLASLESFEAWTMGYKFTPPVWDRTFTILIASVLEESASRQGFVISLPLDVSTDQALAAQEPRGVRGRYVSVERVKEIDGKVEWIMATRSAPGGLIPSFLSEPAMPGKICEDVPHVVEWLKAKRASSG
ncbi:unnamed protein product [Rhizoctonia solani]|uniref:START-like domain protein, putative n=1 Tax=Rhizoctonia solani AG-3 Rhs1AP TaxID=1086054 RepID=X8J402_9AGAM|nr:START-like domain protein, putative [Rhizoctonia solani AG-3 Rhs1AP]CAE6504693.1 unnamed protein product [Rhizoctonia solani]